MHEAASGASRRACPLTDESEESLMPVDRDLLAGLMERESARFRQDRPRSLAQRERSRSSLLSGVPMNWMTRWVGDFPVVVDSASGATLIDVDGNVYVDFCLGDTGAMTGHAPEPAVAAIKRQAERGITAMLPGADAPWVGEDLQRRFGLPYWQLTLSATDANRFVIRLCRDITSRPRVLVHNHCYHGSVDETVVTIDDGKVVPRHGNIGPPVDPALTTRVVEINDLEALERELANGDVACVLVEPALTNIGIVLPDPGYHDALRELTRRSGTLLVIDETHTLCAGYGGYTRAHSLQPDIITMGKAIASGVPTGAYGLSEEVAERVLANTIWDAADVGGVGGTLAGNLLSVAAARATLENVLTENAFAHMIELGERFEAGVNGAIERHGVDWHATRIGCRVEYLFCPTPPHTGAEAHDAFDTALDAYMHLFMLNRGILITPFHMMALMCPATTEQDVDRHTAVFEEAVAELAAG
jgi:glutamate-1-semialdehyde 2,1-aminomutase